MAAVTAERNLLFGLLALQNGLIDQVQLVAAFHAWTRDKVRHTDDTSSLSSERGMISDPSAPRLSPPLAGDAQQEIDRQAVGPVPVPFELPDHELARQLGVMTTVE